jgi:hypothetical protein
MASGNTLCVFTPYANEPTATVYATLDLRNGHPCLDFDAATNENAVFTGILPRHYAGGGITVYLHWAASTDTNAAHCCFWDAAIERMDDDTLDLDADSFAAAQSLDTGHPNATSGIMTLAAIPFTSGAQMDSLAAGEMFRLKITRDAVNDDMTGDGELFGIEIKET